MTIQVKIEITPGESKVFSGHDEPTFEQARAWLKEKHVEAAQAARETRAKAHAETQAKIAEEARQKGAAGAATTLTPDTVKAKGGSN